MYILCTFVSFFTWLSKLKLSTITEVLNVLKNHLRIDYSFWSQGKENV